MKYEWLELVVLHAVGMRTVDDDAGGKPGLFERLFSEHDAHRVVVGASATAAKHEMPVLVAAGEDHGAASVLVHAEEMVAGATGPDGVDGGFETSVGSVLEAHGRGKA